MIISVIDIFRRFTVMTIGNVVCTAHNTRYIRWRLIFRKFLVWSFLKIVIFTQFHIAVKSCCLQSWFFFRTSKDVSIRQSSEPLLCLQNELFLTCSDQEYTNVVKLLITWRSTTIHQSIIWTDSLWSSISMGSIWTHIYYHKMLLILYTRKAGLK
jgi:hypothetical protein